MGVNWEELKEESRTKLISESFNKAVKQNGKALERLNDSEEGDPIKDIEKWKKHCLEGKR